MAARRLKLPALHLELAVEPRVLDGEGRLGGERPEEIDHLRRELTGLVPIHDQAADDAVFADERDGEQRPVPQAQQDIP